MPGAKQKDETTEKPSNKEAPTKPEAPKLSPSLTAIKAKEKGEKAETTEKTSGIKRDMLEAEVVGTDRETAEKIASIDLNKKSAEQKDKWDRLEFVAGTALLPKLFDKGFKIEVLQELESFRSIKIPADITLSGSEPVAFNKLKEITSQTSSELFLDLKEKWRGIVSRAHDVYREAAAARDYMAAPPSVKGKAEVKKETGLVGYMKENPITSAIVITAGACALYGLFFSEDTEKGDGKSASWFEKIFSKKTAIVLGLVTLGCLIGPAKIGEWVEKSYNFTKEKLERFTQLISEERYKDAILSLFEGSDENLENYKKLADIMSKDTGGKVTDSAVKSVADAKYNTFMSVVGKSQSFAASVIREIPGIGSRITSFFMDTKEQAEQEENIRKYLEKNKDKIGTLGLGADATVLQVLSKLNNLDVKVPPGKEAQPLDQTVDAVDTGLGEIITVSENTVKELAAEFKDKPAFQNMLKKYENNWSQIVLHPYIFTNELFKVCKEDGIPIMVGAGKIILLNGYKFVTFTSAKTLFNAAVDLAKAPFSDDVNWSDSIWTYTFNSMPFVCIGFLSGLISYFRGGSATNMLSGVGRGLIFPVEVAHMHLRLGQWVIRETQGRQYTVRKWLAPENAKPAILEAQARFYADAAMKYDQLYLSDQPGAKFSVKRYLAQLDTTRIEALRAEFMGKFAATHNELKGTDLHIDKKNLGDSIKEIKNKMKEFMDNQQKQGKLKTTTIVETAASLNEPVYTGKEGSGPDTKYTYRFQNQEIVLTESEIATKAAEIGIEERAKNNIPKPGEEQAWNEANWNKAIKALAEDKILTPVKIKGKPDTYKFANNEVVITQAELQPKLASGLKESEALKAIAMEKAVSHVTVEDVRIVKGNHEYKIGGEWIKTETPTDPAKLAEIKEAFVKHAKEKGTSFDFAKFASEAKSLKYFSVLEKVMGTAAAVGVIYLLETAKDKRKAVAETAAGFGAFWAGMKLTDWQLTGRIIKNPNTPVKLAARTVIDIMGGIAAAYNLTEPVANIVTNYFEKIPASYGVGGEVADIFEKFASRSLMRTVFSSMEKGLLKKTASKLGLESVVAVFEKKIGGLFLEKIGQLTAKQGFKQVLKFLGWRGATTAALLADDATLIGVVDDVVAAGMLVWMGSDIYDLVKLIANAVEVQKEMDKRSQARMVKFDIKDPQSRIAFQEKIAALGITVDRLNELGEEEIFSILRTFPKTVIEIKRQGMPGKERWTLNEGKAVEIAITGDDGKVIAKISDLDAGKMDEALNKMEVKES